MSRMRPPMLLGPSKLHTWSVLGEPLLALPSAFACAIASSTAAVGMVPSALARWRNIQFSAPVGPSTSRAGAAAACPAPSLFVAKAITPANRIVTAATASAVAANHFLCMYASPLGRLARFCTLEPQRRRRLLPASTPLRSQE